MAKAKGTGRKKAGAGVAAKGDVARVAKVIEGIRKERGGKEKSESARMIGSGVDEQRVKGALGLVKRRVAEKSASDPHPSPLPEGEGDDGIVIATKRLADLRKRRAWKGKDVMIGGVIEKVSVEAERSRKKMGSFVDVWREVVPAAMERRTRVKGLRGGVATIEVGSAATLFEVDRLLRGGAETELRRRYSGTLARVVVRVGTVDGGS